MDVPEGYLDIYCERRAPGLWAEPINTLTNAGFFMAAFVLWRDLARNGPIAPGSRLLLVLVLAIGVGSTLFHAFAAGWARVLDEAPILLFQIVYLWLYLRRVTRWSRLAALAALGVYLAIALYMRSFPQLWNGSLVYVPALVAIVWLAVYHAARALPRRFDLVYAAAALGGGVAVRTLDARVCEAFPLGTHFLWHLLVALVVYLGMRALHAALRAMRTAPAQP